MVLPSQADAPLTLRDICTGSVYVFHCHLYDMTVGHDSGVNRGPCLLRAS